METGCKEDVTFICLEKAKLKEMIRITIHELRERKRYEKVIFMGGLFDVLSCNYIDEIKREVCEEIQYLIAACKYTGQKIGAT